MVSLALVGVNAIACAPARIVPVKETRVWSEYLGTPSRAPSAAEHLGPNLSAQWTADIGRAAVGGIALGDSVIAVQETGQYVTVLTRADGQRRWHKRLDGPGAAGPLITWDKLYAASGNLDGRVYCFALKNGHEEWSRTLGPVVGPLGTLGTHVFAALENGTVVGLNTTNGHVAWRVSLQGPIRSGVAVAGQELLVATDDTLYALALDNGRRLRAAPLPATLAPPAISGDTLIFVTPGGDALAVNRADFTPIWRTPLGEVLGNPAVARDTLFAVTLDGTLWRVPLANPDGATRTNLGAAVRAGPAPIADGVLIGTVTGEILRVGADSVTPWSVRIDGPVEQPPLVDRGSLIAVDGRGRIHLWK